MKESLRRLYEQKFLSRLEAADCLEELASGSCTTAEIAAFLSALNMRPVALNELLGFRDAMLRMALPVAFDARNSIDVCGTGGDGKDTFNISTTAGFVIAALGIPVVKHGNYGVSSSCGSSNVLEALGVPFACDAAGLSAQLEYAGICFVHAPLFHPAMKHVAPVRKELGVKTFFNILGPLSNPAMPGKQLAGVFSYELVRLYEQVFQEIGCQYGVVHGLSGYDECVLNGKTLLVSIRGTELFSPGDLGLQPIDSNCLKSPDSLEGNANLVEKILAGEGTEEQTTVVAINSGLGLYVAGKVASIREGLEISKEELKSGRALTVLEKAKNGGRTS